MSHVIAPTPIVNVAAPTEISVVIDYVSVPEGMVAAQEAMALPLLPIGRATLIEKQVTWLRQCGFRKIFLNVREGRRDTQQFLKQRSLHGVEVVLTPKQASHDLPRLLSEGEPGTGQGVLLMSGFFLGSFFLPGIYHHSAVFDGLEGAKPLCYLSRRTLQNQIATLEKGTTPEAIFALLRRRNDKLRRLRLIDPSYTLNNLREYREINRYVNFVEGKDILVGAQSTVASDCRFQGPNLIGQGVVIEPGCVIGPYVTLADGAKVGRNTELRDTVVAHGASVPGGSRLRNAIVLPHTTLSMEPAATATVHAPGNPKPRPTNESGVARTTMGCYRKLQSIWQFFGVQLQVYSERSEAVGLFPKREKSVPVGRGRHA